MIAQRIGLVVVVAYITCCSCSVEDLYVHLGTKTPYRIVANYDTTAFNYTDCMPVKIWMMIRHGTRYPGKKDIKFMTNELPTIKNQVLQNHRNKNGKLSEKELKHFKDWSPRVQLEEEKNLQHEGEEEMIDLAERMQSRFPTLFSETYNNGTYHFRYTATQRTQQSAVHFAIGLFGRKNAMNVWYPAAGSSDIVLRSYKMCNKWMSQVKKNPEMLTERRLFGESVLMVKTIREVSEKLGYNRELPLNTIYKMYKTCAFETAWHKKIQSPWCHVFSKSNIRVLEYYDDLKYYWIDGYGKELTVTLSCPTVKDLMEHLMSDDGHVASTSFSHSGTLLKILSHLNLWRPEDHLTHKYIDHQRPWMVSKIDAFGTNVAFVRYRCVNGMDHLMALHQEHPVLLPGCKDILCPAESVIKELYDSLHKCDFHEMCKI